MLIVASFLIVVLSIPMSALLVTWGIDWIAIGYGLHPYIAFPLAVICLFNFYLHGKILIIDFNRFCLNQVNGSMREHNRLCKETTTKL